jgi:N-acetylmuramic acid 6-phosphate etherase
LRLLNNVELADHFAKISSIHNGQAAPLTGIAIGIAGARTEADRQRIRTAAAKVWPGTPCYATNDLETGLVAAGSADRPSAITRVLILSGTGSCCFGRTPAGKVYKFGGWGHILGDKGSGYEIGLRALKSSVYYLDHDGHWGLLGQNILRTLQLNEPNDLIDWAKAANKTEIAALAREVFAAAAKRDKIARDILAGAAAILAKDAVNCASHLVKAKTPVEFVLAGSILLKQPGFARQVSAHVKQLWPGAIITPLKRDSIWGALELAREHFGSNGTAPSTRQTQLVVKQTEINSAFIPISSELSPTEQRNPRSSNLDKLPLAKAIALMIEEEARIPQALHKQSKNIEKAIQLIVASFKRGGRLFYAGAGTSGRLGVLDASECPPTFRIPPERVQGIIAGGQNALWKAVEGAEDDLGAGARAIDYRGVNKRDIVIGIATSGRTPFVWGALDAAKKCGASTVLLCFNPHLQIPAAKRPDLVIAPEVGPEILTGSTRLKGGTATKLVLNILTTLAMVRMGKVVSNLMVDLNASNVKLRERAVRIVQAITGADSAKAHAALEKSKWIVKAACERLR